MKYGAMLIILFALCYHFYYIPNTVLPEVSVSEPEVVTECQQYYKTAFRNAKVYGTFEEYPVIETYTGPIAVVNEDSGAVAKRFYTHHKIALEKGVNFAGKYAISDWGFTGLGQMFAVIDVETGDVYPFPYIVDWEFEFRSDSNLIVINPIDSVPDFTLDSDLDCEYPLHNLLVSYYFVFENGEFSLLGPEDTSGLRTDSRLSN
jgi:hypothetical protein